MSKPSTPVRRSKVGPGRPGSAGGEIPLTASMEVLPPDPCASPSVSSAELASSRNHDLHSKPRTPGSTPPPIGRTRSIDGRRSALGPHNQPHHHQPHGVIPLTSTTNKSLSASHSQSPIPLSLPPQLSYGAGVQGGDGATAAAAGLAASQASTILSRYNPMTEGDEDVAGQQQQQAGAGDRVVVSAGRGPSAGAARRYAAGGSVSASAASLGAGQGAQGPGGGGGAGDDGYGEVPGTPASVASGRVGVGGGTFFTDLRRSFADGEPRPGSSGGGGGGAGDGNVNASQELGPLGDYAPSEASLGLGPGGPGAGEASRLSRLGMGPSVRSSRANPMQSPSASSMGDGEADDDDSFAEYAGEVAEAGNGAGGAQAGGRPQSSGGMTDYGNPLLTPELSRAATPGPAPAAPAPLDPDPAASRQSLLLVIRDLYVTEPPPPPSAENSRPATAATGAGEQEGGEEGEEDGRLAADDSSLLAASRAAVAALSSRADDEQARRRSELGEYMTELQARTDDSGAKLVELPRDWAVQLERLFRQRREEYATLQGWLGPRRFEDLPIHQLPEEHPDPRVVEGLRRIRQLDGVLSDRLIAALISHRETFPDQAAEQEQRRMERHTKAVEEALKRERQRRLRAARIARAVTSLDGPPGSELGLDPSTSGASLHSVGQGPTPASAYSRFFTLNPEEEALVERVLQRAEEEEEANPFDLDLGLGLGLGAGPQGPGPQGPGGGGGVTAPDDIDLELDALLPSAAASRCATPSAAPPTLLQRPFSGRAQGPQPAAAEPGGSPSGDRPTSASSSAASQSLSRPGTSSGAGGVQTGMSPIAAAALHGHPVLMAAAGVAPDGTPRAGGGGLSGGLLPAHVYEDPPAAARALRAINARLAAFEAEHVWDEGGQLADFKAPLKQQASTSGRPSSPTRSVAGGAAGGARSIAGGPAPSISGSGVSVTAAGQRDYLREERTAKELANRERDLDAALRSLKTGQVERLGQQQLAALVEQCRRLQELNDLRRKEEEEAAAARRQQQQQQQQQAASARAKSQRTAAGGPSKAGSGGRPPPLSTGSSSASPAAPGLAPEPSTASTASRSAGAPRHNSAGNSRTQHGDRDLAGAGSGAGGGGGNGAHARRASDPASPSQPPSGTGTGPGSGQRDKAQHRAAGGSGPGTASSGISSSGGVSGAGSGGGTHSKGGGAGTSSATKKPPPGPTAAAGSGASAAAGAAGAKHGASSGPGPSGDKGPALNLASLPGPGLPPPPPPPPPP